MVINDPIRSDALPSLVACLGVASDSSLQGVTSGCYAERLLDWRLGLWRVRRGQLTAERLWSGTSAGELWEIFSRLLPRRRSAWLFSGSLSRDLTLCDIWSRLNGTHDIGGTHTQPAGGDPPSVLTRRADRSRVDLPGLRRRDSRPNSDASWTSRFVIDDKRVQSVGLVTPSGVRLVCIDVHNYLLVPRPVTSSIARMRAVQECTEALLDAVYRLHLGPLRITGASQAWYSWRRGRAQIPVEAHDVPEVRDLERRSFFPGRVQLLRHGRIRGRTHVLDIQWAYPAIMATERLPVRLVDYGDSLSDPTDCIGDSQRGYIADVSLSTDAVYPYREASGTVLWCTGKYSTTLAGRELSEAVHRGRVLSVGRWAEYGLGYSCRRWADWLWASHQREARGGREATAGMLKNMGRALFGRFARRTPIWQPAPGVPQLRRYGTWPSVDADTGRVECYRGCGDQVLVRRESEYAPNTLVAVSSWIAASCRAQLQALIDCAGPDEVYYVHTDSLHVSEAGYQRLAAAGVVRPDTMGALRAVGMYDEAEYVAPMHYRLGDRWVISGVHMHRTPVGPYTYRVSEVQSMRSVLAAQPHGVVYRGERVVCRATDEVPGVIEPDGRVVPPHIWNDGPASSVFGAPLPSVSQTKEPAYLVPWWYMP